MNNLLKPTLILGLLLLFSGNVMSQEGEKSVKIATGFGYFDPMAGSATGNILFSKLLFKLPSNVYVGAGIGSSLILEELDYVIGFNNTRTYENYYLYSFIVENSFQLDDSDKHTLTIGSGIIYEEVKYSRPEIYMQPGPNGGDELIINMIRSNSKQNNIGTFLEVNYFYQLSKLSIGLHTKTHLLFDIGIGGLIIAPTLQLAL